MCGILFVRQNALRPISLREFKSTLCFQSWRGPDATHTVELDQGMTLIGHNRLSVLDPAPRADQPMTSPCGRYVLAFNGEIYNHFKLRQKMDWNFLTFSDTETLLAGLVLEGRSFISSLDGMFAFVLYDTRLYKWLAARDPFGIKPLFIHRHRNLTAIASEASSLAMLIGASPDPESLDEWRIIRRPVPGRSYFKGIEEILPGTCFDSFGHNSKHWQRSSANGEFQQDEFESLVFDSVRSHEISDVPITGLLSGGLDSAIIAATSTVQNFHCVGLAQNNEFSAAKNTATELQRTVRCHEASVEQLHATWQHLTKLRGEPLSVPNEGLIYLACSKIPAETKVVLTGEGADELLFGYDNIFRWASSGSWTGPTEFLARYGYSDSATPSSRLLNYIESLNDGKSLIDFTEDFFLDLHLPGLLRRMDFASMAASREARVPFVCLSLINYMYRRQSNLRLDQTESKIPLRRMACRLGLQGALNRRKIGFSASTDSKKGKFAEYEEFRQIVLGALSW